MTGRVAWLARESVVWRGVDVWMPAEDLEQVAGAMDLIFQDRASADGLPPDDAPE